MSSGGLCLTTHTRKQSPILMPNTNKTHFYFFKNKFYQWIQTSHFKCPLHIVGTHPYHLFSCLPPSAAKKLYKASGRYGVFLYTWQHATSIRGGGPEWGRKISHQGVSCISFWQNSWLYMVSHEKKVRWINHDLLCLHGQEF